METFTINIGVSLLSQKIETSRNTEPTSPHSGHQLLQRVGCVSKVFSPCSQSSPLPAVAQRSGQVLAGVRHHDDPLIFFQKVKALLSECLATVE